MKTFLEYKYDDDHIKIWSIELINNVIYIKFGKKGHVL